VKILVINSGSSSIKYQFTDTRLQEPLCKGMVERIGSKSSILTHRRSKEKTASIEVYAPDHNQAISHIFETLTKPTHHVIKSYKEISGIGHRVVHGDEIFTRPTLVTPEVIDTIEKLNELAPLHNPPAISGIRACQRFARGVRQVAVFDTAFHQTIEPYAYIYGIPYELYEELKIRRYGFHGTSHKYVAKQAAKRLNRELMDLSLITCHLGNGCSMTAVKNGRSLDTSLGFTPLEGLLMGTRCGDIDPAIVLYLMKKRHLSPEAMGDLLNKKSGLLGVSGLSNDMRDLLEAAASDNERAKLAIEMFLYRIKKYIGAYAASMDGLDAVVLTAGIGEDVPFVRERIAKDLKNFLKNFRARILVIPTDEEMMISQETADLLKGLRGQG